jgi:hypothetical protein
MDIFGTIITVLHVNKAWKITWVDRPKTYQTVSILIEICLSLVLTTFNIILN